MMEFRTDPHYSTSARIFAHSEAPDVYDAPTLEELFQLNQSRKALWKALWNLERWFDVDQEVLDAMSPDERRDHERQLRLIREALSK